MYADEGLSCGRTKSSAVQCRAASSLLLTVLSNLLHCKVTALIRLIFPLAKLIIRGAKNMPEETFKRLPL